MLTKFLLTFLVAAVMLSTLGTTRADEKADRDRKIRIALALAEAETQAAKSKAAIAAGKLPLAELAPMPRTAGLVTYGKGYEQAKDDAVPLVIYVGCDGPKIDGAATVKVESFPDVKAPAVVVAYAVGNRLMPDKVFMGKPSDAELQRAADNAKRKMDAKSMPAGTGKPLPPPCEGYMILAEAAGPCVCGAGCSCKPGDCPGKCPLTYEQACVKVKKGETVYMSVGKRLTQARVCNGVECVLVDVTAHTDTLAKFEAGVWRCWLKDGKPVMQLVQR